MISCETKKEATVVSRILAQGDQEREVVDVRIGLRYSAVRLDDGRVGVAFTFYDQVQRCCVLPRGPRPLAGKGTTEILSLLASPDPVEASVGMACANALANVPSASSLGGDILSHLDLRPTDAVAMVGHFAPLEPIIRQRAASLTIFDQISEPSGGIRPAQEAFDVLPQCQVALVTATAIINHTIDGVLRAAAGCREVAIVGPSTPIRPEAFEHTGVTMLSGVVVKDGPAILRIVSEGGGMRLFRPYIHKACLRVSPRKGERRDDTE